MSADAISDTSHPPLTEPVLQTAPANSSVPASVVASIGLVAVLALAASAMLWQRVGNMQEQLARQSAQSGSQSVEARTLAKDAQDMARDSAARTSVMEARVAELTLQRTQLEELMQSMSRNRDENLVTDIDSSVRLALQQADLSGSMQPLVASLNAARQRVERAAQPRLAPVIRAIDLDLEHLSRMSVTDTSGVLTRIDDLTRQVDEMPLINDVGLSRTARNAAASEGARHRTQRAASGTGPASAHSDAAPTTATGPLQWAWWQDLGARTWDSVSQQAQELVRVRRIEYPEAILVSPEQGYFLRENLKLQLLNARLALLSRQPDAARADLRSASSAITKYFDPASRRTQLVQAQLQQVLTSLSSHESPKLDETLPALATAAAGR